MSSDLNVASQSVLMVVSLLKSLEKICLGEGLDKAMIEELNSKYKTVNDVKFEGFETRSNGSSDTKFVNFQVLRERILGLNSNITTDSKSKKQDSKIMKKGSTHQKEDTTSSQIEEYKSKLSAILKGDSTDTNESSDVPDNENLEQKNGKDVIEDGTNDDQDHISDDEESLYQSPQNSSETESLTDSDNDLPINVLDAVKNFEESDLIYFDETDDNSENFKQEERDNARLFVKSLKSVLPNLIKHKSSIETDEAIQLFASTFCLGKFLLSN